MVFHGSRLVFHSFSWFSMVPGRFSWFLKESGWFFMVFHVSRSVSWFINLKKVVLSVRVHRAVMRSRYDMLCEICCFISIHMFSPHPGVIIEQVGVDGGLQVEGGRDKTLSSDLGLAGVAVK